MALSFVSSFLSEILLRSLNTFSPVAWVSVMSLSFFLLKTSAVCELSTQCQMSHLLAHLAPRSIPYSHLRPGVMTIALSHSLFLHSFIHPLLPFLSQGSVQSFSKHFVFLFCIVISCL